MAADGVRQNEEAFGDLAVGEPFGDEARDREFRCCQGRPTVRLRFGGDQAAPHAEFA